MDIHTRLLAADNGNIHALGVFSQAVLYRNFSAAPSNRSWHYLVVIVRLRNCYRLP